MADEIVSADSAPGADAATGDTGQAATPADVTHGAETSETPAPTDTSEAESADETELDDDEDASPEGQTEEEKTKAQKRRERREKREQERIDKAVTDRLAAAETERQTKAATEAAERQAQQAEKAWADQFGALVGTPDQHKSLNSEISTLVDEIAKMPPYDQETDADLLEQKRLALNEKIAERNRLQHNTEIYDQLDKFQFENTKGFFAAKVAALPESHRASYAASNTIPVALDRLEAGITAREQAKADARVAAVEAEWKGKLAKEEAAHAATRTGAPGAGPSPNGANGTGRGGGALTPTSYAAMSYEERLALRATPEGRRRIDEMTRSQGGTRNPV